LKEKNHPQYTPRKSIEKLTRFVFSESQNLIIDEAKNATLLDSKADL